MHCLQVTYRVTGLPDDRLRESFAAAIPALQAVPGLRAKLWLAEPNGRSAGGVYVFDGEREADDYLASPLFVQGVHENPHLADLEVRRYSVLDEQTRATSPWLAAPTATAGSRGGSR